jgi:hypothetical protein
VSTTPTPTPSPAPPTQAQNILNIINIALQGLTLASSFGPAVAAGVKLEQLFQGMLQSGLAAFQQETGKPINLADIPEEALLP